MAYRTLADVQDFESLAKKIRENIDTYLEASPKLDVLQKLKEKYVLEFK